MEEKLAELFKLEILFRLQEEYLPRIRKAMGTLDQKDIWWKPHAETTSIGVLLRHLRGNLGQWILSGVGGRDLERDRSREFSGEPGEDSALLLDALEATVADACAIIAALDGKALAATYAIQGYQVTGLRAVFHVAEHFSWHAGQITWIAKLRAGEAHGLAFYDNARLNQARNRGPEGGRA